MKKTELKRRTPLNPGTKPLRSHKPMARGSVRMRAVKPKSEKPKRAARETGEDKLCRGQSCFLLIPGVCRNDPQTVVPCHANENGFGFGKGMGIKVPDMLTVPGCFWCHAELDAGKNLTKDERRRIWRDAYARWGPVREKLFGVPYTPIED
jgi:hypothetical protein